MDKIINFRAKSDNIFSLLTALYITSLLTNLTIGYRYVSLWHFNEAGGIFIFPLSFIVSDMISELYGSQYAKKLILYGILCEFILALYIYTIIRMPHPNFFHSNSAYAKIMDPYVRFTIASSGAILIGSWLNIFFLSRWSQLVNGKYFILRSLGSSFIGELFVTVSSMLFANFGKMTTNQLIYMMLCCFILKTIISLIAVWPAAFFISLLKRKNHRYSDKSAKSLLSSVKHAFKSLRAYPLILEKINLNKNSATIFCKGGKVTITRQLSYILFKRSMIKKLCPRDASYVGYYYAKCQSNNANLEKLIYQSEEPNLELSHHNNKYYITGLTRNKKIIYTESETGKLYFLYAIDIYSNDDLLNHFSSSNACYIGIMASIQEYKHEVRRSTQSINPRLKLVYEN